MHVLDIYSLYSVESIHTYYCYIHILSQKMSPTYVCPSYIYILSRILISSLWLCLSTIILYFTTTWMEHRQWAWHWPVLLILTIWLSSVGSMGPHIHHYVKLFWGNWVTCLLVHHVVTSHYHEFLVLLGTFVLFIFILSACLLMTLTLGMFNGSIA